MGNKTNNIIKVLLVLSVVIVAINAVRAEYSPYIKQVAKIGTYINSVEAEALVIRNETVVEVGETGIWEASRNEGERAAAYTRLGAVVTGNIDENKMNELNRLNEEIDALSQTINEAGILTIEDSKVDSTLIMSLDTLRYSVAKNDIENAVERADDVRILAERKMGITSSNTAQIKLNELTEERNRLAQSLGGAHKDIYSPVAGLYSDKVDGLEKVLTFKNLENIVPSTVDAYFKLAEKKNATAPCKVINNYKWYILFNLSDEDCEELKVGKEYAVAFRELGEKTLNGTLEYMSEPDKNGRRAVTMKFDKHIDNFTSVRITGVEICKEKFSGIYIPGNALRVHEGTVGVWVQNEQSLEFRSVSAVYRSDEFLLVKEGEMRVNGKKNIELYDAIVLNPDKDNR